MSLVKRVLSFFRGKREMTLNTEYVKSMQGILKILEFVSTSDLELYNVSRGLNVINDPKCKKTLKSNNFRGLKCIDVMLPSSMT